MKLALAVLTYAAMASVLCAGILLLLAGKPWLFIFALLGYVGLFSKFGCLSHH